MNFSATAIHGCKKIELQKNEDSRGYFARAWCADEFQEAGLPGHIVQCSLSYNREAGTLRGMHFQLPPSKEGKIVRCVRGAILDAVVDLRSYEDSHMVSVTIRLDDSQGTALYIPPGCAHGFQTLEDDTEVLYMMTDVYQPELSRGFRWDDPVFSIDWPIPSPIINQRDAEYADFNDSATDSMEWP